MIHEDPDQDKAVTGEISLLINASLSNHSSCSKRNFGSNRVDGLVNVWTALMTKNNSLRVIKKNHKHFACKYRINFLRKYSRDD